MKKHLNLRWSRGSEQSCELCAYLYIATLLTKVRSFFVKITKQRQMARLIERYFDAHAEVMTPHQ